MLFTKLQQPVSHRHGLSLVEILVAMVMTLVVLGAMMAAFSYGSAEMQRGRASIELNNRLVSAEQQLRRDLDRITIELKPHQHLPALPKGYVEIVDGAQTDYVAANEALDTSGATPVNRFIHGGNELVFGDRDDFFGCTIKSDGRAFRGRNGDQIIESHIAEVVWFTVFDDSTADPTDVVLVRRQLLVLPSLGTVGAAGDYNTFLQNNDISVRIEGSNLVANSLTDLAIRGNRFAHDSPGAANPSTSILDVLQLGSVYNDNHVVSTAIAAFDIQVFAPDASVVVIPNAAGDDIQDLAEPSDIGPQRGDYAAASYADISGAYVDLGKGNGVLGGASNGYLFRYPLTVVDPVTGLNVPGPIFETYDTGTSQYNRNEANDPGANRVDDDADGMVDEAGESGATVPPYNTPIRGLKFTMRVLEPNTKQVRQLSVTKSFVVE